MTVGVREAFFCRNQQGSEEVLDVCNDKSELEGDVARFNIQ